MAPILGLSLTQLKRLEGGANVPSGETLLKYREMGFNPTWLLTGEGSILCHGEQNGEPDSLHIAELSAPELLGMIAEAIQQAYLDEGRTLSIFDLGCLSAEKYSEVLSSVPEREDWRGAVRMLAVQLRKEISRGLCPVTAPSGKVSS